MWPEETQWVLMPCPGAFQAPEPWTKWSPLLSKLPSFTQFITQTVSKKLKCHPKCVGQLYFPSVCSRLQNIIPQLLYRPFLKASPIQSLLIELTSPGIPIFLSTCWPRILSSPGLDQAYTLFANTWRVYHRTEKETSLFKISPRFPLLLDS